MNASVIIFYYSTGLAKLVVDSSKQLYKQVEDDNLLKGRKKEASMAACIYLACRENYVSVKLILNLIANFQGSLWLVKK